MAKIPTIKTKDDGLFKADKAVKDFSKSHKGKLNDAEHKQLRGLLNNRAKELSKALGTKVSSLFDD